MDPKEVPETNKINCSTVIHNENHTTLVNIDVNNANEKHYKETDQTGNNVGSKSNASNPPNASTSNKFAIDYSIRGTARCRLCKKNIVKGELRIGKSVLFKDRYILQYMHVNCAFKSFRRARIATNVTEYIGELDGLTQN